MVSVICNETIGKREVCVCVCTHACACVCRGKDWHLVNLGEEYDFFCVPSFQLFCGFEKLENIFILKKSYC